MQKQRNKQNDMWTCLNSRWFGTRVMSAAIDKVVEVQKKKAYLFISKEFYCWLWGNFNHIGAIPSPQRLDASFLYHHGKTRWYSYPVLTWSLHLHGITDSVTRQSEWHGFTVFRLQFFCLQQTQLKKGCSYTVIWWEGCKWKKHLILNISIICLALWRILRAKNEEFSGLKQTNEKWE